MVVCLKFGACFLRDSPLFRDNGKQLAYIPVVRHEQIEVMMQER